ncbi:hypothetical protein N1851_033191 [Merluccius polli]|uniref:Uncharacterized protein n=1 Tax=Merluccius polli TaxID=89951 RepID=A0AA47NMZ2_MERPO|nr:hypothetical protein N1851_033191 [Merluccius polli]
MGTATQPPHERRGKPIKDALLSNFKLELAPFEPKSIHVSAHDVIPPGRTCPLIYIAPRDLRLRAHNQQNFSGGEALCDTRDFSPNKPCDSDDSNRASFCDFGIALQSLVASAYPTADPNTQDLLARDQFITHVGSRDLWVSLRSAKPVTLEAAINLASKLELIRDLENRHLVPNAKDLVVSEQKPNGEQIDTLWKGFSKRSLQTAVSALGAGQANSAPAAPLSTSGLHPGCTACNTIVKSEAWEQRGMLGVWM